MRQYSLLTSILYIIGPILIIVSHIGSLLVFKTGLSWGAIAWILLLYFIRMLGTTGIYHRLLTHKSYQAPAPLLWIGCIVTASAGQMGPSWWKAHHMAHHQNSDQALDPHSPNSAQGIKGFYWSQGGWLLSSHFFPAKLPSDVESDRVLQIIDRLHFIPLIALGIISYFIGGLRCYDIGDLYKPEEVAYFVPPQGGDLHKFGSYDRTVDNVFIEWDRNIIWTATDTGLYALSCPNLGKPNLDPLPVAEWSLDKLNEGAP